MTEAPRWRLQEPHYLNVPGTEYDHKEVNQTTRKQVTKHYKVPLLLDPKEPNDWNYPEEVIVAHAGEHNLRADIIFEGPPTMAMEPLNEEARKLSDVVASKSKHPIDSLPGNGFSEDLLSLFTKQLNAIVDKVGGIPNRDPTMPNQSIPGDVVAQLQAQMNELMEKNAALERRIAQKEMADVDPLEKVEMSEGEPTTSRAQVDLTTAQHAQRAAAQIQGRRL
jgi:hypothetical protein